MLNEFVRSATAIDHISLCELSKIQKFLASNILAIFRDSGNLFPLCLSYATLSIFCHTLPIFYRSVNLLLIFCRHSVNLLPPLCQSSAATLPIFCRHYATSAAMLALFINAADPFPLFRPYATLPIVYKSAELLAIFCLSVCLLPPCQSFVATHSQSSTAMLPSPAPLTTFCHSADPLPLFSSYATLPIYCYSANLLLLSRSFATLLILCHSPTQPILCPSSNLMPLY
jgi:hypothetical protein